MISAVLFQPTLMGEARTSRWRVLDALRLLNPPDQRVAPSPEAPKRKKDLVAINDGRD